MAEEEIVDLSGDGGVVKKIIRHGIGNETPCDGCTVYVHYEGKFMNGEVFDSSIKTGQPFSFRVGLGQCIKAFDIGIGSMKKDEKCILTCAPEYAYGKSGAPPNIPPDSTLIFEVWLMDWQGEDLSPESDFSIERYILSKSEKRKTPNDGAHVKVHITGKYEERIFEDREVEFDVGEGQECGIIEGIEIALPKICLGEVSRLKIKPKFAFGAKGHSEFNIPPNATVEYIVKLIECEKAIEEWKLDKDESLVQAKIFKEKGNNYLKKDKYKLAMKMYQKSLNYLSNCDDDESKQVSVAVRLNIALCNQKLNDFFEAKSSCNEALEIDPNNIKGLYRRGQCYFSLGDYDKALTDFQKVHELDPNNKAAINQITICKQKIKEFHEREKKVYANMFSKFAAVDDKKNTNRDINDDGNDAMNSCGVWTEEEIYNNQEAKTLFSKELDKNVTMV